jgi:hypothetical protein
VNELAGVVRSLMMGSVPDPATVTPGPVGFLAILFVGVAVILLGFDMVRRIRRTTYRSEIQERLKDELAERDNTSGGASPGSSQAE